MIAVKKLESNRILVQARKLFSKNLPKCDLYIINITVQDWLLTTVEVHIV